MISTLLIWLYIFLISTSFGHLIFIICATLLKTEIKHPPSLAETSIFGLMGIGLLLSYFSIFYKIGLISNIVVVSIVLVFYSIQPAKLISYYSFQFRKLKEYPSIIIYIIILYLLIILFAAQAYPNIYDTGLYHAQLIQWISSFKAVPGLGNLHGRFAFNNQSFLLESLFSIEFLKLGYFHLLNSFLLAVISVSLILDLHKTLNNDRIKSILPFGLLILLQIYYLVSASSPSPDTFSAVGIWFIFITIFKRIVQDNYNKIYWAILIFGSFFLMTVKLASLPLALLVFLYLFSERSGYLKKILLVLIIGLLVFTPFFIRNYIISGYLIYPYPVIDLFNPDWKIPLQNVQETKSVIVSWAQSRDWQTRSLTEWFPIWFYNLSTGYKFMSVCIVLSPFLLTLIITLGKNIIKSFQYELKIIAICFFAIIFWFFSAPNFRFVYGFLFIYILLFGIIFLHYLFNDPSLFKILNKAYEKISVPKIIVLTYSVIILFPIIFFLNCDFNELKRDIMIPSQYSDVPVKRITINNLVVNIPEDNAQCWNTCIPCSIFQSKMGITDIELRGEGLADGFRVRK